MREYKFIKFEKKNRFNDVQGLVAFHYLITIVQTVCLRFDSYGNRCVGQVGRLAPNFIIDVHFCRRDVPDQSSSGSNWGASKSAFDPALVTLLYMSANLPTIFPLSFASNSPRHTDFPSTRH